MSLEHSVQILIYILVFVAILAVEPFYKDVLFNWSLNVIPVF